MVLGFVEQHKFPTELLEPEEDGLYIITSGEDDKLDGFYKNSIMFLWYVGRPRSVDYSFNLGLHHPVVHNGHLVALTGQDALSGVNSWEQGIYDLTNRRSVINDATRIQTTFDRIASYKGELLATHRGEGIVHGEHFENGWWNTSDIGVIENGAYEILGLCPSTVHDLVSTDELFMTGWYKGKEHWTSQIYRSDLKDWSQIKSTEGDLNAHGLGIRNGNVLVGRVGAIDEVTKKGQTTTILDSVVHSIFSQLANMDWSEWYHHKPDDERRKFEQDIFHMAKTYGYNPEYEPNLEIPDQVDFAEIRQFLETRYKIAHFVEYNGKLLYSRGRDLCGLGYEEPAWRFRNRITGMVVISNDLLKDIKGRASVRRSNKATASSALLKAA